MASNVRSPSSVRCSSWLPALTRACGDRWRPPPWLVNLISLNQKRASAYFLPNPSLLLSAILLYAFCMLHPPGRGLRLSTLILLYSPSYKNISSLVIEILSSILHFSASIHPLNLFPIPTTKSGAQPSFSLSFSPPFLSPSHRSLRPCPPLSPRRAAPTPPPSVGLAAGEPARDLPRPDPPAPAPRAPPTPYVAAVRRRRPRAPSLLSPGRSSASPACTVVRRPRGRPLRHGRRGGALLRLARRKAAVVRSGGGRGRVAHCVWAGRRARRLG